MFITKAIVSGLEQRIECQSIGLVVVPLAPFFLDGLSLIIEICLVDHERPHAIGFEKQPKINLICRQRFVVFRAITIGRSVHAAAVVLDEHKVFAFAHIFRALKHHVLKKMGKARSSGTFVSRTGVVNDRNRICGGGMVFGQDNTQSILKLMLRKLDRLSHPCLNHQQ